MKLTDALIAEHGVFYIFFDQVLAVASSGASVDQLKCVTRVLSAAVETHAGLEEALLFPALEPHLGTGGPLAVMRDEHADVKQALEQMEGIRDAGDGAERVVRALHHLRDHFQKEESVLFSIARQILDDETQNRLGEAWAEARRVTVA